MKAPSLKQFPNEFGRREPTQVFIRMQEVIRGLAGLEASAQVEITKREKSQARYGKGIFDTAYTPVLHTKKVEREALAMATLVPQIVEAPQALPNEVPTILDEPIEIDPLKFEAMSADAKTDGAGVANQTPVDDPVETELQHMITDTVEKDLHDKVAELNEAAAKAAMTTKQSFDFIAEITNS